MSKFVVLGATGQLGAVLYSDLKACGYEVYGLSRNGPDLFADVRNESKVISLLQSIKPDYVINSAALVSLQDCQNNNRKAFEINSYPSFYLANIADSIGFWYAYISTDHYYLGEQNILHSESYPISLVNTYAYSKHIGELYTLKLPNSPNRTNITGFRHNYLCQPLRLSNGSSNHFLLNRSCRCFLRFFYLYARHTHRFKCDN